jgi:hypothetical protein
VTWAGVTAVWGVGLVAGWLGLIWPYYVVFVVAVVAFQLWYFRESLRSKWPRR